MQNQMACYHVEKYCKENVFYNHLQITQKNFIRRQQLIAAALKRYHKQKEELERHLVYDNEYYMIRARLIREKDTLHHLGVNIE